MQCEYEPNMPTFTALKKSRNFIYLVLFFIYLWPRAKKFREKNYKFDSFKSNRNSSLQPYIAILVSILAKKNIRNFFLTLHVRTINNYTSRLR